MFRLSQFIECIGLFVSTITLAENTRLDSRFWITILSINMIGSTFLKHCATIGCRVRRNGDSSSRGSFRVVSKLSKCEEENQTKGKGVEGSIPPLLFMLPLFVKITMY